MSEQLLSVQGVQVEFKSGSIITKAVNGVSFNLGENESLGIVGESGSGKSVTATSLLRLIPNPPGKITNGKVIFKDKNLLELSNEQIRKIRGNEISMIFQDPSTSLNPVFKVGDQIIESIRTHKNISKKEARKKAIEMLDLVGIPAPEKRINMYPHEFSGGMRQRVMIAIALSCDPKLLIADEPTTALDVTVQAQILNLMKDLQEQLNMSIIMITHDLGVVWETCDKVLVMYAGKVVESGSVKEVYENPLHPYTWGLLDSQITESHDSLSPLATIPGSPPDLSHEIKGCPFADRCPFAQELCYEKAPELKEPIEGHAVACHFQTEEHKLERREDVYFNGTTARS
ncbi:peptide/nickel transport system ATP-binding protein/oligopeptide transport system ATP-binding protein [Lentibacillus persicus]|uniref:Peptide/nickel transport system ATP-binding protein/oligopeptide transport system ATP-binding protein n=1 Tax=Lentibacillus persicus TaxID=640948 RepID=A0A1I1VZA2_9BACI|nr:ABC transporter ATP-binding protein [Lentibacillus persicus]SFD88089.1 peptide/nickel transport system ATP-binding protein/oligopeptide transport system ATP-binding protein [Lentibacillus persicus]